MFCFRYVPGFLVTCLPTCAYFQSDTRLLRRESKALPARLSAYPTACLLARPPARSPVRPSVLPFVRPSVDLPVRSIIPLRVRSLLIIAHHRLFIFLQIHMLFAAHSCTQGPAGSYPNPPHWQFFSLALPSHRRSYSAQNFVMRSIRKALCRHVLPNDRELTNIDLTAAGRRSLAVPTTRNYKLRSGSSRPNFVFSGCFFKDSFRGKGSSCPRGIDLIVGGRLFARPI